MHKVCLMDYAFQMCMFKMNYQYLVNMKPLIFVIIFYFFLLKCHAGLTHHEPFSTLKYDIKVSHSKF